MSYDAFQKWTCMFPGKGGISWKQTWSVGTKEEAEAAAAKNCNVVAVPVQLYEKFFELQRRMMIAERELDELYIRWSKSRQERGLCPKALYDRLNMLQQENIQHNGGVPPKLD